MRSSGKEERRRAKGERVYVVKETLSTLPIRELARSDVTKTKWRRRRCFAVYVCTEDNTLMLFI